MQSLVPEDLHLGPFLDALAYTLRGALDIHIDVSAHVARDCPPCRADKNALEAALLELVVIARDAMPDGGHLRFSAAAGVGADGRPAVALSVADSGGGIAAALRAAQARVAAPYREPLAGKGLAAVDDFARQSGGRLTLGCEPGIGMIATLSLPQSPSSNLAAAMRAAAMTRMEG